MKKIKSRKEKIKLIKITKRPLIILSTIILIITTITVNAGTQDSNLERTTIDNVYAIANLEDGKHLYNLEIYKMNNRTAYCLEIGKKITTNTYNSTTDLTTTGLSNEQIEYIKKIMYYGYDYSNHNDYRYYMAAQELIWEYIENIDVYWTTELDLNGQEMPIEIYKRTIEKEIERSSLIPSFSNKEYQLLAGQELELEDTNRVLSDFDITITNTVSYNKNNNILNISTNKDRLQSIEVTLTRKNYYFQDSTLYYSDSSQKLISAGKLDMPTTKFNIETIGGNLNIKLVDADTKDPLSQGQASLTGASYAIYDENDKVVDTFTTEEGVLNRIENLLPQKYYIKQLKASQGYKLNDNIIEFEINSFEKDLVVEEEIIKSKLEILKLFGNKNTGTYNTELGIKFNIYDNNSNLYQTIITDELGYTETELIYGNYTIKQENTTPGYEKIPDLNITIDENTEEKIRYNLFDDIIETKINIITIDKESNKEILEENITYKLKDKNTEEYISYNGIDTFKTNKSGQVLIPQSLPYGTYILEQVTSPQHYMENNDIITIVIDDNSNYTYNMNNELVLNVEYYNQIIKGVVHITTNEEQLKISENKFTYEQKPTPNKELEIYAKEDIITPDGELHYNKGDKVDILSTNEEGKVDTPILYLGEYCIEEVSNNNYYCLKLENKDNITTLVEEELAITSEIEKYNITLTNIDDENNTIKGSVIELYTENDELINTSITNDKGIIKINNLPNGKYYFIQKSVNSVYQLNEDKLYFEIKDDNIALTIINKKTESKVFLNIPIPNTLSNKKYIIEIISLLLIILGVFIYVIKKKNNNSHFN